MEVNTQTNRILMKITILIITITRKEYEIYIFTYNVLI